VEDSFEPKELVDRSAQQLNKLVAKKAKSGEDVVTVDSEAGESDSKVVDLIEILNRSLKGTASAKSGAKPTKSGVKKESGSGDDLDDLSKAELYERAQQLDVPGRSGMSKQELAKAIRRSA
jgi:DNA end-binding protein Ku